METIVLNRQSLLDVAIQTAGSVEAVFDIAAANDVSITDELSGKTITVPNILDKPVADYFQINRICPATDITAEDIERCPFGGINYMGIEIDYMVR
jgi:hypothetical protein